MSFINSACATYFCFCFFCRFSYVVVQQYEAWRLLSEYLSVCLSVSLSVRYTRELRLNGSRYQTIFAPLDTGTFLVSWSQISQSQIYEFTQNECMKDRRHPVDSENDDDDDDDDDVQWFNVHLNTD